MGARCRAVEGLAEGLLGSIDAMDRGLGRFLGMVLALGLAAWISEPVEARRLVRAKGAAVPLSASPTPHASFLAEVELLLNQERQASGLAALSSTGALRQAAAGHSRDMAGMGQCTHTGSDGSRPGQRMLAAGVPMPYGEIIACGHVDPAQVVAAWMNSPGHRDIILCSFCSQLGAGYHWDPGGFRHYWTVDFGQPGLEQEPTALPTLTPLPTVTATDLPPLTGDTNCDLLRNIVDAQYALQYDVGLRQAAARCPLPPGSLRLATCDVDADGDCNAVDALWLLRCSAGEDHPQCGQAFAAPARRLRRPAPDPGSSRRLGLAADSLLAVGVHPIAPGMTVAVPLTLTVTAGQSVGALTGELRYDPHVARANACALAPGLFGTCNIAFDDDGVGTDAVRFSVIALTGLTGSQNLIDVSFLGLAGLPVSPASGTLSPYLEVLADPDGQPLTADLQAGALIWSGPTATPAGAASTATPTALPAATATSSPSPSATASATRTVTPSVTASATASAVPSATATASPSASVTSSPTATLTAVTTATSAATTTATATATLTAAASPSSTANVVGTATAPPGATGTSGATVIPTGTATVTPSPAVGATQTSSGALPSQTPSPTPSAVGFCVSGELFHDQLGDGWQQLPAPDYGIGGAQLELLRDSDASGSPSGGDTLEAAAISLGGGAYQLCSAVGGVHFLRIPAGQFLPGALLDGYQSSQGNDQAGQPPSPHNGVDGDDNGRDQVDGGVATLAFVLGPNNSPAPGSVDLGLSLRQAPTGLPLLHAQAWIEAQGVRIQWALPREGGLAALHVERRSGAGSGDGAWQRLTLQPLAPEQGSWLHRTLGGSTDRYRLLGIGDDGRTQVLAILRPRAPGGRLFLPALRASGGRVTPRR